MHAEHLTLLAAELRCIGQERYRLVNHERMCLNPRDELVPIAEFCGLTWQELSRFFEHEQFDASSNNKCLQKVSPEARDSRDQYFDERRVRRWELLLPQ